MVELEISPKGGTIKKLKFDYTPIKQIEYGFYGENNIKYLADQFTGHSLLFMNNKKYTDLDGGVLKGNKYYGQIGDIAKINKEYTKFIKGKKIRVDINIDIKKKLENLTCFRIFTITINPEAFNLDSLYYICANGGDKEKYYLKNPIDMSAPVDYNISSNNCLGCTDDELIIGDEFHEIKIKFFKHICYTAQMIKFEKIGDKYFLRIYNSIGEHDETSKFKNFPKNIRARFEISENKVV